MASGGTRVLKVVIAGDAGGAMKAFDGVAGKARSFGGTLAKLGAGVSFAAIGAGIYQVGSGLEQNLNLLQSLDSSLSFDKVNASIKGSTAELNKLGFSGGDAAAAMVELSKAGRSGKDVMASYKDVLVLARAGQLEVGDAATAVSNTLNVFGLKGDQAARVTNVLANAANLSSASVGNLLESLQQGGNVAASAGLSFEQTAAALANMANNGIQGSDAGTSLKTMLNRLTSDVGGSLKAVQTLGVSVYTSTGQMRPMGKVMEDLSKKLAGLSDRRKAEALYKIFGSDALRAGKILLKDGTAAFQDLTKKVSAAGMAQKVAAARTQGFSGQINRLKASAKSAGEQLYLAAAPTLAKSLKTVLDGVNPLVKRLPELGTRLKDAFASASKGGTGKRLGDEFRKMGPVLMSAGNKILPVLQDFGKKFMDTLGPGIKSIGDVIAKDFLPGVRAIIPVLAPVAAFILKILGGAVIGVLKGAILVIKGAFQIIGGLFTFLAALVHGDWSGMWTGIKTIFSGAINAIKGAILIWWNMGIINVFRRGITTIIGSVKGLWRGIKGFFEGGTKGVGMILTKIIKLWTWPYLKAFEVLRGFLKTAWSYIKGEFSGGVGGIRAILGRVIEVITWPYRQAFALLRGIVTRAWSAIKGLFTGGISGVMEAVKGIPGAIKGALSDAGTWLLDIGKQVVQGLVNGIKSMGGQAVDAIKGVGGGVIDGAKSVFHINSPSRVFHAIGEGVNEGLSNGITASGKQAVAAVTRTTKAVTTAAQKGLDDSPIDWDGTGTKKKKPAKSDAQKAAEKAAKTAASNAKKASAEATRFGQSIGKLTVRAYVDSITKSQASLQKASYTLTNQIKNLKFSSAGQKNGAIAALRAGTARLSQEIKKRDAINVRLKATQKRLADLIAARAEVIQNVRDKINEAGDITSVFSSDEGADNTAGGLIARLRAQANAAKQFGANVKALAARGLNSGTIQQIINAGVEQGSKIADGLLSGGPGAISEVNAITSDLNKQATSLGTSVGDQMYKAGIDSAKGLVKGLQSQQAAIEQTMLSIARGMVGAIKTALGIRSPSRVFHALGGHTATGFANGINDEQGTVQQALNAMAGARPNAPVGFGKPNREYGPPISTEGGVNLYLKIEGNVIGDKAFAKSIAKEVRNEIARGARSNGGSTGL